jgi:hypothetical protein
LLGVAAVGIARVAIGGSALAADETTDDGARVVAGHPETPRRFERLVGRGGITREVSIDAQLCAPGGAPCRRGAGRAEGLERRLRVSTGASSTTSWK